MKIYFYINMNSNKKSFIIFELLLVVIISSIIIINTFIGIKELYLSSLNSQKIAIYKIDLLSSKLIIKRNIYKIKTLLKYKNSTLYFNNALLLEDVKDFTLEEKNNFIIISFLYKNHLDTKWVFKL